MDVLVTLTFQTLVTYADDEVDITEIDERDAFDQLHSATYEDIIDNWTLIEVDVSEATPVINLEDTEDCE